MLWDKPIVDTLGTPSGRRRGTRHDPHERPPDDYYYDWKRRAPAGWDIRRPVPAAGGERQQLREVTLSTPRGGRVLPYGTQRLGGEVLFTHKVSEYEEWVVVVFGRGEGNAYTSLLVNNVEVSTYPEWKLQYWTYLGTSSQTANAQFAAVLPSWSSETLADTIYAIFRLRGGLTNWPTLPTFLATGNWLKTYDPRNLAAPKAFSTNLFCQYYDFLRHAEGKALTEAQIETADFSAAATIADELVSGRARFANHMYITDDGGPEEWIRQFDVVGNCRHWWESSKFRLWIDRPAIEISTPIDDSFQIRNDYAGERTEPFEKPNHIVVEFTDVVDDWRTDKPEEWKSAGLLAGTEEAITSTYKCLSIHDRSQAKRLAIYLGNEFAFDFTLRRRLKSDVLGVISPGDRVRNVLAAKGIDSSFRVQSIAKLPDNSYDVIFQEYNAARYSDTTVADGSARVDSTLPDEFAPPPNVANLYASVLEGYVTLLAEPPGDRRLLGGFEWRRGATNDWDSAVQIESSASLSITDHPPHGTWWFLVKAYTRHGIRSTTACAKQVVVEAGSAAVIEASQSVQFAGLLPTGEVWIDGETLIEGMKVLKSYTFMFSRMITWDDLQAEIDADGYADFAAFSAAKPYHLWAPLTVPDGGSIARTFSNNNCYSFGDSKRNQRIRHRLADPRRLGIDDPSVIALVESMLGGQVGSERVAGKSGWSNTWGFRQSTNHAYAQAIIESLVGSGLWFYTVEQLVLNLDRVTLVSDGSGVASRTLPVPMGSFQKPHISWSVISAGSFTVEVFNVSNTGYSIKVVNSSTGAVASGVSVDCVAWDRGGDGTTGAACP